MTLKELCNISNCSNCPCRGLCSDFSSTIDIPGILEYSLDKRITDSIIETAKTLQEDDISKIEKVRLIIMVKIGHARSSENGGKYGTAGDQTGNEVSITDWYDGNWTRVFRPVDIVQAEKIASFVEKACKNDNIGYSQSDRLSLYNACIVAGGHVEYITQAVNCDCSSLVACACINAGINISPDMYTAIEESMLMSTGKFIKLTALKYLQSYDYLMRGDILLKSGHTAVVLTNGKRSDTTGTISQYPCAYKDYNMAGSYLTRAVSNMREFPSIDGRIIAILNDNVKVKCYGYYNIDSRGVKWLFVEWKIGSSIYQGYMSEKVLRKNE